VSAALSGDRKTLTFAVVNPSDLPHDLRLSINGIQMASTGRMWRMAPATVDATITVGKEPEVQVQELPSASLPGTIAVPPFSVTIYSYAVE